MIEEAIVVVEDRMGTALCAAIGPGSQVVNIQRLTCRWSEGPDAGTRGPQEDHNSGIATKGNKIVAATPRESSKLHGGKTSPESSRDATSPLGITWQNMDVLMVYAQ